MEIKLYDVYSSYQRADKDKNGTLSKQELALEALRLSDQGKSTESGFFATMLLGGNDGKGLFPDYYGANGRTGTDNEIGLGDLFSLAAADADKDGGSVDSISSEDFKVKFGDRAGAGNEIDKAKLEEIAHPEGKPQSQVNGLMGLIMMIMMMMRGGMQAPQRLQ